MMSLQTIDRRFREEIADPLKSHLMQKTPPDYARLQEAALPLGQDALRMGEIIEHEFIRLKATSAQSTKQMNETARDPMCAPHKSSWQTSLSIRFGQHRSSKEDPRLVEEGKGARAWQNEQSQLEAQEWGPYPELRSAPRTGGVERILPLRETS